jgi:DNA-binding transcriptional LysR family regulator
MEEFQHQHPGIDLRIDASDVSVDLDTSDVDIALRYALPGPGMQGARRLCGEQLAVVASPWLLKTAPPIRQPSDLAQFTLIEAGDAHRTQHLEWLSWRRWFDVQQCPKLQPQRWLYFNYAHQIVQATLSGQGLALARMPLVADALASGDLIEVLPGHRLDCWSAPAADTGLKSRPSAHGWRPRLPPRARPLATCPTPTPTTTWTDAPVKTPTPNLPHRRTLVH